MQLPFNNVYTMCCSIYSYYAFIFHDLIPSWFTCNTDQAIREDATQQLELAAQENYVRHLEYLLMWSILPWF